MSFAGTTSPAVARPAVVATRQAAAKAMPASFNGFRAAAPVAKALQATLSK